VEAMAATEQLLLLRSQRCASISSSRQQWLLVLRAGWGAHTHVRIIRCR
jgi:hypothetical protein